MKAKAMGVKAIKTIDSIVNHAILVIIVALLAFAGYSLWDSKQITGAASKSNYESYKPVAEDEGASFEQIRAINPEVIAWLEVYGTNIDYPVTQAADNTKYVNTNALGQYSLSGAIFLDAGNSKDFSDFISVIYGHHMEKNVLFGDIGRFADKDVFESHRYGNLYYEGKDHGIEFCAYLRVDAYDRSVFSTFQRHGDGSFVFSAEQGSGSFNEKTTNTLGEKKKQYLTDIISKAMYTRDVRFSGKDRLVLLVTCSTDATNGRDILVGRLTDEVFADPFAGGDPGAGKGGFAAEFLYGDAGETSRLLMLSAFALLAAIAILAIVRRHRRKNKKEAGNEAIS